MIIQAIVAIAALGGTYAGYRVIKAKVEKVVTDIETKV